MVHQEKTVHPSDREEITAHPDLTQRREIQVNSRQKLTMSSEQNYFEITPHPDLVQMKERKTNNSQQVTMPSKQNYFEITFQQSAIKVRLDQRSQLRASESSLTTTHEIPRRLPVPEQRFQLGPFSKQNLMSRWLHVKHE
jgi:hypothetical protein